MSVGSTAMMRASGSASVSVAVRPSLNLPYFGLRGMYLVTVKRRPQDLVHADGAKARDLVFELLERAQIDDNCTCPFIAQCVTSRRMGSSVVPGIPARS